MNKQLYIIVVTLFLAGLTACGAEADPVNQVQEEPEDDGVSENSSETDDVKQLSYTDATGATVNLDGRPEKIVCLTEICVDILYELGLEPVGVMDRIAALPEFFGEKAEDFTQIGGSFFEPNLEDIAHVQPDLVIGLGGVHDDLRDGLQSIAPLYIMNPRTYEDSIDYLLSIGELMDQTEQAEQAAERFLERLDFYKEHSPQTKIPLMMYGSDVNFGIDTVGTLQGHLLKEVGPYPWTTTGDEEEELDTENTAYSVEELLEVDPDVLFVQTIAFGDAETEPLSEQMAANALWKELQAVRTEQVYEVSFAIWGTGRGTRSLGLVLDEAMSVLYPEIFTEDFVQGINDDQNQ